MCLSAAPRDPITEPAAADSNNPASDGLSDKLRPVFKVGDEEVPESRLTSSSADTAAQDVSRRDVPAAASDVAADAGDAVKLSTPKCQPLDTMSTVTSSVMHKSASKYAAPTALISVSCPVWVPGLYVSG